MLTAEDNELVTRVGAGTPMGDLLRRYWIPFLLSAELAADGEPQRVRLLGEDLLAFRSGDGTIGLVGERCPHRGASLYFGRNEACGIRCIYHGWKFDRSGACVDMPSEPEESNFRDKIRIAAYACAERCGYVWAYLGPQPAPALPGFEWMDLPESHHIASMRVQDSNWLQGIEGEFDQSHTSYLHSTLRPREGPRNLVDRLRSADKHPVFDVVDMPYGTCIAAGRKAPDRQIYWRTTQHLMPFFSMTGIYGPNPRRPWRAWVPIDDTTTLVIGNLYHPLRPFTDRERADEMARSSPLNIPPDKREPPSSKPWGRYRPQATLANDFFQDRALQRTETYSGIPEFWAQDAAVQISMGPICDRTQEHLGTSDRAVIALRRRLLAAAKALRDDGAVPAEIANPDWYRVRADGILLDENAGWFAATETRRAAVPGTNADCP
jgi:phthalate 4,5-dioxygenase oxygenase subunit